jgi:hypothetical protein
MPAIEDLDFEARWNAWRARGEAHERLVRRQALRVLPAIVCAAGIVYAYRLMW